MIYTELTQKAMKICFDAHREQRDKGGMPYVFHPFHVADQMDTEKETCVALLHDLIEDTDWTLEKLAAEGFPFDVLRVLELMTHDSRTPYLEYIGRLSVNPIAKKVKLADLRHNSTRGRLKKYTENDEERLRKYLAAQAILTGGTADPETMTLRISRQLTGMEGERAVLEIIYEPDGRIRNFLLRTNIGREEDDSDADGSDAVLRTTEEESYQDRESLVTGLEKRHISAAQIPELFARDLIL